MRLINCDPIALTGRPPIGGLRPQTFHHGAGVGAGERRPAPVRRATHNWLWRARVGADRRLT